MGKKGKKGKIEEKSAYIMALCVFCLLIIQRFVPAFRYGPVMDDWFLYGDLYDNIWTEYIITNRKFVIRPMAGLVDTFICAPLFNHLWIVKLLVCVMLFAAAVMICRVLRKNDFAAGGAVFLFICLFPLNLEASYWLSAATRIVFALFFIAFSVWLLSGYFETKKYGYLIGYAAAGFAAVGFCEQAVPVYLVFSAYIIVKNRDFKLLAIPFVHAAAIAAYYIANSSSPEVADRGQFLLDLGHIRAVSEAALQMLGEINARMTRSGFSEGMGVLLGHKLVLAAAVVLSAVFGWFAALRQNGAGGFKVGKAAAAAIAALSGIAVFYVILGGSRFTVRSMFFFTAGAGAFIGEILRIVPKKIGKWIDAVLFSLAAFVFTAAGAGVVNQYNTVSEHDAEIASYIIAADSGKNLENPEKFSYLLDSVNYYSDVDSVECWESIRSACGDYAYLTGCVRHRLGNNKVNYIMPLPNGGSEPTLPNGGSEPLALNLRTGNAAFFALMPDRSIAEITAAAEGENIALFDKNGVLYGRLVPDGDLYKFEKRE